MHKRLTCCGWMLLLLITGHLLRGQYSPLPPEKLNLENYSPKEIRIYILMLEPENTRVYRLAKESKNSTNFSVALYAISALNIMCAWEAYINDEDLPQPSIKQTLQETRQNFCTGGAIVTLGMAIWQTTRARRKARKALRLKQKLSREYRYSFKPEHD